MYFTYKEQRKYKEEERNKIDRKMKNSDNTGKKGQNKNKNKARQVTRIKLLHEAHNSLKDGTPQKTELEDEDNIEEKSTRAQNRQIETERTMESTEKWTEVKVQQNKDQKAKNQGVQQYYIDESTGESKGVKCCCIGKITEEQRSEEPHDTEHWHKEETRGDDVRI